MEAEYLKTLWMLRFEKIKRGEEHAVESYTELAAKCEALFGEDQPAVHLLRQLILEERGHVRLAEELIRICSKTHPECESLSTGWEV